MTEKEISEAWFNGDVDSLRHEIERLREEAALWESRTKQGAEIIMGNVAEIERLRDEAAIAETIIHGLRANRDDAETEIERLKAEAADKKRLERDGWL